MYLSVIKEFNNNNTPTSSHVLTSLGHGVAGPHLVSLVVRFALFVSYHKQATAALPPFYLVFTPLAPINHFTPVLPVLEGEIC